MSKWISVKDRLPRCNSKFGESNHVLCYCGTNSQSFVGWYHKPTKNWYNSYYLASSEPISEYYKPTHWMPLPDPPKNIEP